MPRISAATVAEHRAQQRTALLNAAAQLLATGGVESATPKAVGTAAGLARSSVYQYFSSSADLIAAVVEERFPLALAQLDAAVDQHASVGDRVDAYVEAALMIAADPIHKALFALGGHGLPDECRDRVAELHGQLQSPLRELVADLGRGDEVTVELLGGLLTAGASAIMRGRDVQAVVQQAQQLIRAALDIE
jgi:AcrR family transcriptional regulator